MLSTIVFVEVVHSSASYISCGWSCAGCSLINLSLSSSNFLIDSFKDAVCFSSSSSVVQSVIHTAIKSLFNLSNLLSTFCNGVSCSVAAVSTSCISICCLSHNVKIDTLKLLSHCLYVILHACFISHIVIYCQFFLIWVVVSSDILVISDQLDIAFQLTTNVLTVFSLAHDLANASDSDLADMASLTVCIFWRFCLNALRELSCCNAGITCWKKSSHNLVKDQSSLKYGLFQATVALNNIDDMNCLSATLSELFQSFIILITCSLIVISEVCTVQSSNVVWTFTLFLYFFFFVSNTSEFSDVIHILFQNVSGIWFVAVNVVTTSLIGSHVKSFTKFCSVVLVSVNGVIVLFQLLSTFGAIILIHCSNDIHAVLNDVSIYALEALYNASNLSLCSCLFIVSFNVSWLNWKFFHNLKLL